MSSQPKFIIYKCDTCARQTELQLDGSRPDPTRCNITLKCRGKLGRVAERSAKKTLFTPLVAGLEDYVPRGTRSIKGSLAATTQFVSIFTAGGDGILAAAVLRARYVGPNIVFYVKNQNNLDFDLEVKSNSFTTPVDSKITVKLFELTPELLTFKKYTYLFSGTTQLIRGQDNSPEGRNLRFNVDNNVKIFVNGVELDLLSYDRTVNDQITLTPAISDANTVIEVLVYNDIDQAIATSNLIDLDFEALVPTIADDIALRELDCWGNAGGAIINGINRYTLFCSTLTLDPEKTYGVARIEATSASGTVQTINPAEFYMLLGREPFAPQDKELFVYLSGSSLVVNDTTLSYSRSDATGAIVLAVDSTTLTQVYNPIQPFLIIEAADAGNLQGGNETAQGSEVLKKQYIIGPS